MNDAVNLSDVRKSFGDVPAVDGLSLTIRPGETVALLVPIQTLVAGKAR
jgi:ABC-2 type transport system ATP-binding protein